MEFNDFVSIQDLCCEAVKPDSYTHIRSVLSAKACKPVLRAGYFIFLLLCFNCNVLLYIILLFYSYFCYIILAIQFFVTTTIKMSCTNQRLTVYINSQVLISVLASRAVQ